MIKILFDHQTFSLQRYGGISRYFANLFAKTQNRPDIKSDLSILYSQNHYIHDQPGALGNMLGSILLRKQKGRYKWNQRYSSHVISQNKMDVFHPTNHDPYFLDQIKKPFVLTVHDMIHERLPQYFDTGDDSAYAKRLCIERADHLIAISESTKRDLQHYYDIEDDKISVIHHGFEPSMAMQDDSITGLDNYLLYVGDRRAYKNFPLFLVAVAPLLKSTSLKLICAGGGEFKRAETEQLLRLKIQDLVTQRSVSDEDLTGLYRNAKAFIYPSLYEGFGLPLLEAFQNRCPVIASDIACFREVGDDALEYFDPNDPEHIAASIQAVIEDADLQRKLSQAGERQLLKFPISNCVEKTVNVYKHLAN